MLKRTPLFAAHQKLGARLIDFGGWEMPVQYSSIVDEHLAVRKSAGLFDISHMGELLVRDDAASDFLNHTLTNDVTRLAVGQGQYTLMCNERGGVIDDLYAYRLAPMKFLLMVNASRIEADGVWLQTRLAAFDRRSSVQLRNDSEATAAVAVQGPRVAEFIDQCIGGSSLEGTSVNRVTELKKNQIARFGFATGTVWVARTGYTGEDGFEVVANADLIPTVWERMLAIGHQYCLQPCGLGARDTLRTEVCYPLYGHELDEQTTPIEAGLGTFVALDKSEFIGRARLMEQKSEGVPKKCVAFKMTDKAAPPRPHYPIWSSGSEGAAKIGQVASGTQSPSLGVGIGMGYVPPSFAKPGTPIQIEIRGKLAAAVIVAKPLYRKPG